MTSHSRSDRSPSIRLPKEGQAALEDFQLAPDLVHLNHGSYGAVPKRVLARQETWRTQIESDPTGFFQEVYPTEIRRAAGVAAARFGGAAEDWVFCENATAAVNSVLASLALEPGDEVVTTSHAYGAVLKAIQLWCARRGANAVVANVPSILENERQVIEPVVTALTRRTRLLVIDHITSATAVVFPIEQLVAAARRHGIPTLIDGAHAPGQIPLSVTEIGCDWYTGNAHKWFFAPRGCGLLWTTPERQPETFPVVLSHGTDRDYTSRFDWIGTRDVSPWLSLDEAGATWDHFGGAELRERNRALAAAAADQLARASHAQVSAPPEMRAAMASLFLRPCGKPEMAADLRAQLHRQGIVAPVSAFDGRLWIRVSAQVYNQLSDYGHCADALLKILSRQTGDSKNRFGG